MSMSFARIVTTCWGVMTVTRWSRTIAASVIPISSIVRSITCRHRTYRFAFGGHATPLPNSGDGLEGVEDTAGDQIVLDPPPEHLLVQVRPAVDLAEGESHPDEFSPALLQGQEAEVPDSRVSVHAIHHRERQANHSDRIGSLAALDVVLFTVSDEGEDQVVDREVCLIRTRQAGGASGDTESHSSIGRLYSTRDSAER